MRQNMLISILTAMTLAASTAAGENIPPKELNAIENTDVPVHSYWALSGSKYQLKPADLQYLKSVGLIHNNKVIQREMQQWYTRVEKAPIVLLEGVSATINADKALERDDTKTAQKALQTALEKFSAALKENPALKRIPVATEAEVIGHPMTLDQVRTIRERIDMALEHNDRTQVEQLTQSLKNEIDFYTTYLRTDSFPKAVAQALDALKEGKSPQEVRDILIKGMQSFHVVRHIVPVPLLVAQDALYQAAQLDNAAQQKAAKLLTLAGDELEIAKWEGYLDQNMKIYQSLSKELKTLQKRFEAGNGTSGNIEKINRHLGKLIETMRSTNR